MDASMWDKMRLNSHKQLFDLCKYRSTLLAVCRRIINSWTWVYSISSFHFFCFVWTLRLRYYSKMTSGSIKRQRTATGKRCVYVSAALGTSCTTHQPSRDHESWHRQPTPRIRTHTVESQTEKSRVLSCPGYRQAACLEPCFDCLVTLVCQM